MLPRLSMSELPLGLAQDMIEDTVGKLTLEAKTSIVSKQTLTDTVLDHMTTNLFNINAMELNKNLDSNGYVITGSNLGVLDVALKPSTDYAINVSTWLIGAGSWYLDKYGDPINKPLSAGVTAYTTPADVYFFEMPNQL